MDGTALKARRVALGYSQAKLAALLGVDVMTISRWERGLHPVLKSVELALQHLRPARGAAGGKASTPKKTRAVRRNAKKPRKGRT
jgi:transcriptional regulator with XRE-family HTH domain